MNVIFAWGPPSTNMYDFTFLLVLQTQWIELLSEGTFSYSYLKYLPVSWLLSSFFMLFILKGPGVGRTVRLYSIQTTLVFSEDCFLYKNYNVKYSIKNHKNGPYINNVEISGRANNFVQELEGPKLMIFSYVFQVSSFDWKNEHQHVHSMSMLSSKVMPYLLRLAAPLMNSSIVQ